MTPSPGWDTHTGTLQSCPPQVRAASHPVILLSRGSLEAAETCSRKVGADANGSRQMRCSHTTCRTRSEYHNPRTVLVATCCLRRATTPASRTRDRLPHEARRDVARAQVYSPLPRQFRPTKASSLPSAKMVAAPNLTSPAERACARSTAKSAAAAIGTPLAI